MVHQELIDAHINFQKEKADLTSQAQENRDKCNALNLEIIPLTEELLKVRNVPVCVIARLYVQMQQDGPLQLLVILYSLGSKMHTLVHTASDLDGSPKHFDVMMIFRNMGLQVKKLQEETMESNRILQNRLQEALEANSEKALIHHKQVKFEFGKFLLLQ